MDIQEFIVDRDQHMRPLEYDLSENFNELLRYMQDMGILDNVPVGTTSESEIISISDAYPAPPRALTVNGASTQDGTPTPDAPVPILSVDELTVYASADGGTTDYTNWPVSDLLPDGTDLRSLPDGTRDTLSLSYLRPSTREGWAWYERKVVQAVGHVEDMGELTWGYSSSFELFTTTIEDMVNALNGVTTVLCDHYNGLPCMNINGLKNMADDSISTRSTYKVVAVKDTGCADATLFTAAVAGMELDYPLATPVTTQLDPIELPTLPAPTATVWCDGGSATPTLMLEYVRDASAAIADLSEAIADIVSG